MTNFTKSIKITYIFYEKKTSNIFRHPVLVPYLKKYKKSLFFGAVAVFITNISLLAIPQLIRFAVDNLRNSNLELFYRYLVLIVIVAILAGVFRFLMRNILFSTGRIIEQEIRSDFFAVLLKLPQEYYQEKTSGDLLSRALNDMDSLRYLFGHVIMHIINIVSVFSIAFISLSSINLGLTIIAITPFPLLFFFTSKFSKSFYKHHTEVMRQMGSLTNNIQEMFSLITIIKAYTREDPLQKGLSSIIKGLLMLICGWQK